MRQPAKAIRDPITRPELIPTTEVLITRQDRIGIQATSDANFPDAGQTVVNGPSTSLFAVEGVLPLNVVVSEIAVKLVAWLDTPPPRP